MKKRSFKILSLLIIVCLAFTMTAMVWAVDEIDDGLIINAGDVIICDDGCIEDSCGDMQLDSGCSAGMCRPSGPQIKDIFQNLGPISTHCNIYLWRWSLRCIGCFGLVPVSGTFIGEGPLHNWTPFAHLSVCFPCGSHRCAQHQIFNCSCVY
jgi:hypothetical protein